jgi:AcrR family transcriptional regulator
MSTSKPFHHGDLKAALARSAASLIERSGVEALSLREVAREAGVSTAAPYRHYASKEALLAEVAQQGFQQLRDELVAAAGGLDPRPAFLAQCLRYVRFAQQHSALYRLMFGLFPDKHRYQGLVLAGDRLFELLDERLSLGGKHALRFRSIGCWAFVHGLAMLAIDDQLRMHLPGTDSANLLDIIRPIVDMYACSSLDIAT